VQAYAYWELVAETASITQHVSSVALFVVVFLHTATGALAGAHLLALVAILAVAGLLLRDVGAPPTAPPPTTSPDDKTDAATPSPASSGRTLPAAASTGGFYLHLKRARCAQA
jgi:hypothetical protein